MANQVSESVGQVTQHTTTTNVYIDTLNMARNRISLELGLWTENIFETFIMDDRTTEYIPTPDATNFVVDSTLQTGAVASGVVLTPFFFPSYNRQFSLCKLTGTGTLTSNYVVNSAGWYTFSFFTSSAIGQSVTVTVTVGANSSTTTFTAGVIKRTKLSVHSPTNGATITVVVSVSGATDLAYGDTQLEAGVLATEFIATSGSAKARTMYVIRDQIKELDLYTPQSTAGSNIFVYQGTSLPYANIPVPYAPSGYGFNFQDNIFTFQGIPTGTTFCYFGKAQPTAFSALTDTVQISTQDRVLLITGAVAYLTQSIDAGEQSVRASALMEQFKELMRIRKADISPKTRAWTREDWC